MSIAACAHGFQCHGRAAHVSVHSENPLSHSDNIVTEDLEEIEVFLLDGSEVDEEYFKTLPAQTTLILRRPGEKLLTEADILYQMLKKVNESYLSSGQKAEEFLTDKLKVKLAVLHKALNDDDSKTVLSNRKDDPAWFDGLETTSQTKEAYLHRRCQDRIRGYLYKTIEQIKASEIYNNDKKARSVLESVIIFFKLQLKKDHYFGFYFDRTYSPKPDMKEGAESGNSLPDDETDGSGICRYEHCPCRLSWSDYEKFIMGLNVDEVDAKKFDRTKEEIQQLKEQKSIYKITIRNVKSMTALCDKKGEFRCSGTWNRNECLYSDCHKINPYRSKEELVLFSTWNLDHKIERSRTLIPQLLEAARKDILDENEVVEIYNNLFTSKNLRLVHIVCHDKSSHK
ncbi:DNA fragmentation factor subunit beta isoform X2 [Phymastichus coffea]|uniref:DNA fragmentation factor subunit beta isoform X2 n=1 Tax=Phymastichus coffea TaxID=108790 RepID=UPI00273BB8D5|nr:DNA fragmentation factor subunit beta isoform X2 [Phymastichus coffea]